jgi:hypothetical protein
MMEMFRIILRFARFIKYKEDGREGLEAIEGCAGRLHRAIKAIATRGLPFTTYSLHGRACICIQVSGWFMGLMTYPDFIGEA